VGSWLVVVRLFCHEPQGLSRQAELKTGPEVLCSIVVGLGCDQPSSIVESPIRAGNIPAHWQASSLVISCGFAAHYRRGISRNYLTGGTNIACY
jgi:hypothetical protein